MISILNILRIIGVILVILYAGFYIFKNYENVAILFVGILTIIITSFLISFINYKNIIEPFFISNGFDKSSKNIKIKHINYDDLRVDYVYFKDDLNIAKLNISKKEEKNKIKLFNGVLFKKDNVDKKPFTIHSSKIFKKLDKNYGLCKLDNTDFNKYFQVYCEDKIKIYEYFTPKKLEKISQIAKELNKKISLIYEDNSLFLYLHDFRFSKEISKEFELGIRLIQEFSK